jgi:hypothetical protein
MSLRKSRMRSSAAVMAVSWDWMVLAMAISRSEIASCSLMAAAISPLIFRLAADEVISC